MIQDLSKLVRKSDEYAEAELAQCHIDEDRPDRKSLYWAVFTSHLAYLLNNPQWESGEKLFGHYQDWPGKRVGDTIFCQAAAPGSGHCIYLITRIEHDGDIYAMVIEDTIRELTPDEVI